MKMKEPSFTQQIIGAILDFAHNWTGISLTNDTDRQQEVYNRYKKQVDKLLSQGRRRIEDLQSIITAITTDLLGPSKASEIVAKAKASLTSKLNQYQARQDLASDYANILLDKAANETFTTADKVRGEPNRQEEQLQNYLKEVHNNVQEVPQVEQTV